MDTFQPLLSFRLLNGEKLESGRTATAQFSMDGGTIGHNEQCNWSLQDNHGAVAATQCKIIWQDQGFCLQTISEPVYINRTAIPQYSGAVRLSQGDQIQIGELVLKTHINLSGQEAEDPMLVSPQSIISTDSNPLDSLMEEQPHIHSSDDNYSEMASTVRGQLTIDPLKALDNESLTTQAAHIKNDPTSFLDDHNSYQSPRFASPFSDNQGNTMVQEYMDLPKINPTDDNYELDIEHVAINPLMQGLGAHLHLKNSQQANDFLVEIGQTLRAAVEGLLNLQQQQENLQDKQLRPIEDNPLRLDVNYDEALKLLFTDERSPVHLSPAAAVSESLSNMQLHYHANQEAISIALATMLDAFSPERLLARFSQYRRVSDGGETDASWAWKMYNSYFKELSSSRQQGFEKLFYEVYAHSYDRALRKGL